MTNTNTKIKRNKLIIIALIATLAIVVASMITVTSLHMMSAHASEYEVSAVLDRHPNGAAGLARHTPTLDSDFAGDRVIVILRQGYSDGAIAINTQSFKTASVKTAQCVALQNISDQSSDFSDSIVIDSIRDRMPLSSPSAIFTLYLREYCKEGVLRAIKELEQLDKVYAAEPDYNFGVGHDWTPNDPFFKGQVVGGINRRQWGLTQPNGIQAQKAWNFTRDNANVRVGIMEGGFDVNHPDLAGNSLVLPGGFRPGAGADLDHGTHVAGIVGAIADNGIGIAGVSPNVSLVNLNWNINNFVEQLDWAAANGIRIINASFRWTLPTRPSGITPPNPNWTVAQRDAVIRFGNNRGILVASAGNQGNNEFGNTDLTPQFPAGFGDARNFPNVTNVISVGNIQENGARAGGSSFGMNSVHIYAPGTSIVSTFPVDRWNPASPTHPFSGNYQQVAQGYALASGTSMAAPHVAGVAALMLSVNPYLTAVQVRNALLNNADQFTVNVPDGVHQTRLLNAHRAVASVALRTSGTNSFSVEGLAHEWVDDDNITKELNFALPLDAHLVIPDRIAPLHIPLAPISEFIDPEQNPQRMVVQISPESFQSNDRIQGVTIPSSVASIENNAFYRSTNLERVYIERTVAQGQAAGAITTLGTNVFTGTRIVTNPNTSNIFVPRCSVNAYKNAANWSAHSARILPTVWDGRRLSRFVHGEGTAENPYQISIAAQLAYLAAQVNGGNPRYSPLPNATNPPPNKHFILTHDIFLNSDTNLESWETWTEVNPLVYPIDPTNPTRRRFNEWQPIGNNERPFRGIFNGDGFAIRGIYISTSESYQGLFGVVEDGTIMNLGIKQSRIFGAIGTNNISGSSVVGSIAGLIRGSSTIVNNYNFGTVQGRGNVGGIVGSVLGSSILKNNHNAGEVNGYTTSVGGIAGFINNNQNGVVIRYNYFLKTLGADGINTSLSFIGNFLFQLPCTDFNRTFDRNGTLRNQAATANEAITIGGTARNYLRPALNAAITESILPPPPLGIYWRWTDNPLPTLDRGTHGLIIEGTVVRGFVAQAGFDGNLRMPEGITAIRFLAFSGNNDIISVHIPSSLTHIEHRAFSEMENLTNLIIPSTVTHIEEHIVGFSDNVTIYTEHINRPNGWHEQWNPEPIQLSPGFIIDIQRPVFWGVELSACRSHVVRFNKTNSSITRPDAINGISPPIRAGYTFMGWYNNATGQIFYANYIANAPNGMYHTRWERSPIITFYLAGGTGDFSTTMIVPFGATMDAPIPTKENYEFMHWVCLDFIPFNWELPITSNVMLIAIWQYNPPIPSHIVIFYLNDGTGNYFTQEVIDGWFANMPQPSPTKPNYSFRYWALDGVRFEFSTRIRDSIILTAVWSSYHTVTFSLNNGTGDTFSIQVNHGDTLTPPVYIPTHEDYTFMFWGVWPYAASRFYWNTPITQDITLYAIWSGEQGARLNYIMITDVYVVVYVEGVPVLVSTPAWDAYEYEWAEWFNLYSRYIPSYRLGALFNQFWFTSIVFNAHSIAEQNSVCYLKNIIELAFDSMHIQGVVFYVSNIEHNPFWETMFLLYQALLDSNIPSWFNFAVYSSTVNTHVGPNCWMPITIGADYNKGQNIVQALNISQPSNEWQSIGYIFYICELDILMRFGIMQAMHERGWQLNYNFKILPLPSYDNGINCIYELLIGRHNVFINFEDWRLLSKIFNDMGLCCCVWNNWQSNQIHIINTIQSYNVLFGEESIMDGWWRDFTHQPHFWMTSFRLIHEPMATTEFVGWVLLEMQNWSGLQNNIKYVEINDGQGNYFWIKGFFNSSYILAFCPASFMADVFMDLLSWMHVYNPEQELADIALLGAISHMIDVQWLFDILGFPGVYICYTLTFNPPLAEQILFENGFVYNSDGSWFCSSSGGIRYRWYIMPCGEIVLQSATLILNVPAQWIYDLMVHLGVIENMASIGVAVSVVVG